LSLDLLVELHLLMDMLLFFVMGSLQIHKQWDTIVLEIKLDSINVFHLVGMLLILSKVVLQEPFVLATLEKNVVLEPTDLLALFQFSIVEPISSIAPLAPIYIHVNHVDFQTVIVLKKEEQEEVFVHQAT